jgi:hypothetical protein
MMQTGGLVGDTGQLRTSAIRVNTQPVAMTSLIVVQFEKQKLERSAGYFGAVVSPQNSVTLSAGRGMQGALL